MLQKALANAHGILPSSVVESFCRVGENLNGMDPPQTNVQREHRGTDILPMSETHKLEVIIENKVGGTEHDRQPGKYARIVRYSHPDGNVLKICLTPNGAAQPIRCSNYYSITAALARNVESSGTSFGVFLANFGDNLFLVVGEVRAGGRRSSEPRPLPADPDFRRLLPVLGCPASVTGAGLQRL